MSGILSPSNLENMDSTKIQGGKINFFPQNMIKEEWASDTRLG